MTDSGVAFEVRQLVRATQNVVQAPKDCAELESSLYELSCLLPGVSGCKSQTFSQEDLQAAKAEFQRTHYRRFCEILVNAFSVDWIEKVSKDQRCTLIDVYFLEGNHSDSFLVLMKAIESSSHGYKLNKCVLLLDAFLEKHNLASVLWESCLSGSHGKILKEENRTSRHDHDTQWLWEELAMTISTLPERVTNKLQKETSEKFYPQKYVPFVAKEMLATLKQVHLSIKQEKDCSVEFLSFLLGKLCFTGHGDLLWSCLLPVMAELVSQDYVWCRVCEHLVTSVPDRCMESVLLPIIKTAPWYGIVYKLLGGAVSKNSKVKFILTNKLLLMRHFEKELILQNILGYLSLSHSSRPLLVQTLARLLDVWGNGSALKHSSYEQHLYISKALLICLSFLNGREKEEQKESLILKLMPGLQSHLDSAIPKVRRLGMLVGMSLTKCVDPNGHKLQFQYDEDAETELLLSLLVPPPEPQVSPKSDSDGADVIADLLSGTDIRSDGSNPVLANRTEADDSELDSDDDLEPFDMSHDQKSTQTKVPRYIRDCMDGLISTEDPDRLEACLGSAEKLIRMCPDNLEEIAVELCKVLLHLSDNFSTPSFVQLRFSSLVALLVQCPSQVAAYLTSEFYESNYNLRQRMDILDVLAAAARELSQPSQQGQPQRDLNTAKPYEITSAAVDEGRLDSDTHNWQAVVQRRIESKTRRFGTGRTKPEPVPVANRFAPVAGDFFFPLLRNFDRKENTLDLLGGDSLVLGRLLYTLGAIIYAATNAPIVTKMACSLMEFIWILRYHPEGSVRRALLFSTSMLLLAVPGHVLLGDLQAEVTEAKFWLQDVLEKDPDSECKKMAVQALVLLENIVRQQFSGDGLLA